MYTCPFYAHEITILFPPHHPIWLSSHPCPVPVRPGSGLSLVDFDQTAQFPKPGVVGFQVDLFSRGISGGPRRVETDVTFLDMDRI